MYVCMYVCICISRTIYIDNYVMCSLYAFMKCYGMSFKVCPTFDVCHSLNQSFYVCV